MKTSQKDIKDFNAVDVTYITLEEYKALKDKEGYFIDVCYSMGTYGCNGCIIQGFCTGTLYKVAGRTTALFMFM